MRIFNVGILVFDDMEVLDFSGPFEVFSRTRMEPGVNSRRTKDGVPFNVYSVARTKKPVLATGELEIMPKYDFASCPALDLLVVLGGGEHASCSRHRTHFRGSGKSWQQERKSHRFARVRCY